MNQLRQALSSVPGKDSIGPAVPPDPENMKRRVSLYATISRRLLLALASAMLLFSVAIGVPLACGARALDFPIVLAAGVIGGFVSLQRRLKGLTDEDLHLLSVSRVYIWLSPFVGGIFASVLYLLFLSGLLADAVFPHFSYDEGAGVDNLTRLFHMRSQDPAEYAKLFFWSFVAGFSEMFVVNLIEKFDVGAPSSPSSAPPLAPPLTSPAGGDNVRASPNAVVRKDEEPAPPLTDAENK